MGPLIHDISQATHESAGVPRSTAPWPNWTT
jgi:hypothetical protein